MRADEFPGWALGREGRWELRNGAPVRHGPRMVAEVRAKGGTVVALAGAISKQGLGCEAFLGGPAVRIDAAPVLAPDAQVRCGPRLPGEAVEVTDPVVVVESLAPATRAEELAGKVGSYLGLPSVRHVLVLDTKARRMVHHLRGERGIETSLLSAGDAVELDPPEMRVAVAEMFGVEP